jgi:hypothetical protein
MTKLGVTYTVIHCSGPLKTFLQAHQSLDSAVRQVEQLCAASPTFAKLPYEWLFVTFRYGAKNFYGEPTAVTNTLPNKFWKYNRRLNEFVAEISFDAGSWERHDKELRQRTYRPSEDISNEVSQAFLAAVLWVERIHGIEDPHLLRARDALPRAQGVTFPDDLPSEKQQELVAVTKPKKN